MRGSDLQQSAMFSYLSPEQRVPSDHPLRPIRQFCDKVLLQLSPLFETMYSDLGSPSIAPERLLRSLLLQVLYTVRSERMLMEQLNYNLLFRWFVGLNMDEEVWHATVYSKNRDRLLEAEQRAFTYFFSILFSPHSRFRLCANCRTVHSATVTSGSLAAAAPRSGGRCDAASAAPCGLPAGSRQ